MPAAKPVATASHEHSGLVEERWRWPALLVLAATVPAFYLDLLKSTPSWIADATYLAAALVVFGSLLHWRLRRTTPWRWRSRQSFDLLLATGLLLAAAMPPSGELSGPLLLRLGVSGLTLIRMMRALRHWFVRGGLSYLLALSVGVLGLCGLGFWWLEPHVGSLGDGLWLAFTTAATVGYGDIVPSTTASKIFAVFVVLLGYGVLSLVTASIAAVFVESQERRIEREILHEMHAELRHLRAEVAALKGPPPLDQPCTAEARASAMRNNPSNSKVSISS